MGILGPNGSMDLPGSPAPRDPRFGHLGATLWPLFLGLGSLFFGLALFDRASSLIGIFSTLLLMLFLAWFLAFLVTPVVDAFHDRLPRISRALTATTVYGFVLAALVGGVALVVQVGAAEASDLLGRGAEISARIQDVLNGLQDRIGLSRGIVDLGASFASAQASLFPSLAGALNEQLQTIASTTVLVLGNLFLVVMLSLYAVIDSASILSTIRRFAPADRAEELDLVQRTVSRAFRGFVRIQVTMVAVQTVLTFAVAIFFGLPYLFLVTTSSGLAMFVPVFGPGLALLPPIFVAVAFRGEAALPVLIVLFVVQTVIMNAVLPRLVHRSLGLHPILVVVALLVGAQVAGIWGAFFGIPIAAVTSILVRYVMDKRAIMAAEGIELEEAVAEVRIEDPEAPIEEATRVAAERVIEESEAQPDTFSPPVKERPAAWRLRWPWRRP